MKEELYPIEKERLVFDILFSEKDIDYFIYTFRDKWPEDFCFDLESFTQLFLINMFEEGSLTYEISDNLKKVIEKVKEEYDKDLASGEGVKYQIVVNI